MRQPLLAAPTEILTDILALTASGRYPSIYHLRYSSLSPCGPGTDALPKLFTATLVGVLIVTPLSSIFLSRPHVHRESSLRQLYILIATALLGFYLMYMVSSVPAGVAMREVAMAVTGEGYNQLPPPPHESALNVKKGDAALDGFQRAVRPCLCLLLRRPMRL